MHHINLQLTEAKEIIEKRVIKNMNMEEDHFRMKKKEKKERFRRKLTSNRKKEEAEL